MVAGGLILVLCVVALGLHAYRSTAAPRDAEQEHEQIVHRGATACGVERWSVKTGIDRDARLVNLRSITPTNIIKMRSLTPPAVLPTTSRIRPVETTVWSESAVLARFKMETDSDYHLVLSDTGGRTMIAEIPHPQCVGSQSPFLPAIRSVRRAFDSRYTVTDQWQRVKVPVQVSGVGFFDFKHGQSGVAPNAIELHPVLALSFGKSPSPPLPVPGNPSPSQPKPPAPSGGSLFVQVSVSPNPMPYGAHATVSAKTVRGATCYASVVYSTGHHPVSFDGSARTASSSGIVSWSWHEETKGSGGVATVTCQYQGKAKSAQATFTVNH